MRNALARASVVLVIAGGLAPGGYTALHPGTGQTAADVHSQDATQLVDLHRRLAAQAADVEQALARMDAEQRRLRALVARLQAQAGRAGGRDVASTTCLAASASRPRRTEAGGLRPGDAAPPARTVARPNVVRCRLDARAHYGRSG